MRLIANDWRPALHAYLGGCIRGLNAVPLEVGGVDDHVHFLAGMRPTECIADLIREVKKASTRWIRGETAVKRFAWQEGYGAFTVSRSHLDDLVQYIRSQEEHHRKRSFQEEYVALLKRHGIEYDERYLW